MLSLDDDDDDACKDCPPRCCCCLHHSPCHCRRGETFCQWHAYTTINIHILKHHFEHLREDVNQTYIITELEDEMKLTTPLLMTVSRFGTDPECVRYLVRRGADVNFRDFEGKTLIHHCLDDDIDLLKYLIRQGADPFACTNDGRNALMMKMNTRDRMDDLLLLLLDNLDVNAQDDRGNTALHWVYLNSCRHLRQECLRSLIERGADPTIRNNDGDDVLQLAYLTCYHSYEKIDFSLLPNSNGVPYDAMLFLLATGKVWNVHETDRFQLFKDYFKHHRRYKKTFVDFLRVLPKIPFYRKSALECLEIAIKNQDFGFDYEDTRLVDYIFFPAKANDDDDVETRIKGLEMVIPYIRANVQFWSLKPQNIVFYLPKIIVSCAETFCKIWDVYPNDDLLLALAHCNPVFHDAISLLHIFCIFATNARIVEKLLVSFGTDDLVNAKDLTGYTPLLVVCVREMLLLLSLSLSLDDKLQQLQNTEDIKNVLVNHGACLDAPNCQGITPGHFFDKTGIRSLQCLAALELVNRKRCCRQEDEVPRHLKEYVSIYSRPAKPPKEMLERTYHVLLLLCQRTFSSGDGEMYKMADYEFLEEKIKRYLEGLGGDFFFQ